MCSATDDLARRRRIQELAVSDGLEIDKPGVLDVLVTDGSFDVQACPGSGKTTTVATKIVVLLTERRQSGALCVLTHTNVAREEIQAKLRRSQIGRVALTSPHFIGTIQSFVDTFLALPYLRAKGFAVEQIDNDAFEVAALAEFRRGHVNLRAWLKRNPSNGEDRFKTAEYDAITGDITFDGSATGLVDKKKPAYQELLRLKESVSARGIFRHGDMYFYATKYLDEYPWAVAALRSRFSMLIVDEMQDTSARQERLLNRIFPPDKTEVQRFGDVNQAIFDTEAAEDDASTFPRDPVLYLGESRRFGKFIADNIAIIAPHQQTILGDKMAPQAKHTIFLFDERTALNVIPAFAQLAAEHLRGVNSPIVRAIGNRKRPADKGAFPHSLNDYVAETLPDSLPTANNGGESMRLHVERARLAHRRDCHSGASEVLTAIRRIIRLWSSDVSVRDVMRNVTTGLQYRKVLGCAVLELLQQPNLDETTWSQTVDPLMKVLSQIVGCEPSSGALDYVKWSDAALTPAAHELVTPSDLPVAVKIETIHAVKGQNHDATLVLETQFYEHDVSLVIPFLADPAKIPRAGKRLTMHRRRMFVAMSRPRNLLCLAAAAAAVDERTRSALSAQGWCVADLTTATNPAASDRPGNGA